MTRHSSSRRGTVYLLVLGAGLLVVTLGIGAVAVARTRAASQRSFEDLRAARAAAISGIQCGIAASDGSVAWRDARKDTPEFVSGRLGKTTVQVFATDPKDDNIADNWSDVIELESIATIGDATQRVAAQFTPVPRLCTSLRCALVAGDSINFNGAFVDIIGTVAATKRITATSSTQTATRFLAGEAITGSGYTGTQTIGGGAPELPSADALAYLQSIGTPIAVSATVGKFQRELLSDATNPFGPTNPYGVYVIDCGGAEIIIRDSRIRGTLVLINPGSTSGFEGAVSIEPSSPNLPALVVSGNFSFRTGTGDLTEAGVSRNFNPTGSPFNGVTDTDSIDSYASSISGVVWVSGNISVSGTGFACDGAVIAGGAITMTNDVLIRARAIDGAMAGFVTLDRWQLERTTVRRRVK